MSKDATATTAQPVDAVLDEMERFETVIAACERPDFPASNRDTESAVHRIRSSDPKDLPTHLVACIALDIAVMDMLSVESLPESTATALRKFSAGLAASVANYKKSLRSTLLTAPYRSPYSESLRAVVDLAQQSKRLRRRLVGMLGGEVHPAEQRATNDGPVPPNRLRWQGQCHELQPRVWGLIHFMWSRNEAPEDELQLKVWGATYSLTEGLVGGVKHSAIKATVSRANDALVKINCPIRFTLRTGNLYKETP